MRWFQQKIRPDWVRNIILEVQIYGALEGCKIPRLYFNYVVLMCNLVDEEPTCFEEASKNKECMDGII